MKYLIAAAVIVLPLAAQAQSYRSYQTGPRSYETVAPNGDRWTTEVDPDGRQYTSPSPYNDTISRLCNWDDECEWEMHQGGR